LYTLIDDLVESVRMCTPTGRWESKRLPASGAGPSPDRLVLGSEGTLGVITEAWVRVQARPTFRASATVKFKSFEAAVAAARGVAQAGLYPANCRLLDAREAMLHQVAFDGSSVLLLAFESAHHPVEAWLDLAVGIATGAGGVAAEKSTAKTWKDAFFEGPYRQSALVGTGLLVDTFETAITWERFPALHDDVIRSVKAALGKPTLVSCRFTHVYPDGPAPYYTFLAPDRGDPIGRWREAKAAAGEALVRHGATITHHHAVGRTHRPWYDRERPEPFAAALRAAKQAVDPGWILNPGVLIDPPTGR
jgi:alkyldihydroxyacetonephosphate synthase